MNFIWILILLSSFNPLLMLIVLIVFLLYIMVILAFWLENYLFCYFLFLLFISGLMMMLMYFCSIILSEKYLVVVDFSLLVFFFMFMFFNSFFCYGVYLDYLGSVNIVYFEFFSLLKYLLFPYGLFTSFFIVYLLICLVVVYEIVNRCGGPLRIKS